MHTELIKEQLDEDSLLNSGDDLAAQGNATYKGAKVIYLAAHRSKQMIREEAAMRDQAALVRNLPYASLSFRWLLQLKNWCSKLLGVKKNQTRIN